MYLFFLVTYKTQKTSSAVSENLTQRSHTKVSDDIFRTEKHPICFYHCQKKLHSIQRYFKFLILNTECALPTQTQSVELVLREFGAS